MSDKQREKLQSFNYQAELTRGYSYKGDYESGLDHDEMNG